MHHKFIALIIASAIAVTGVSAVPAHAGESDAAKFLAGLAAIAFIGAVIHDNRKDESPQIISRNNAHSYTPVRPRPVPPRVSRFDLPRDCLRNHALHGGPNRLMGTACLERRYPFAKSLPRQCFVQFDYRGFARSGYEPKCLKARGYRLTRK